MRVAVDGQIFGLQKRGGISRYFVQLIEEFQRDPTLGVQIELPWIWSTNFNARDARLGRYLPVSGAHPTAVRMVNHPFRRRARGADIVHHTYYDARYLSDTAGLRRVITVHDMIAEVLPEQFLGDDPHIAKATYIAQADLILCVSNRTRDDLLERFALSEDRVWVTPLGVDPSFQPGLPPPTGWPRKYVLFVGERGGYKNFPALAEAFAAAGTKLNGAYLAAVGGGEWSDQETQLLHRLSLTDRAIRQDVSDAFLARAYSNALAFVMPSLYEGFGLPALEAMASGCPAVLAEAGSLPEVGGNAAAYFLPRDIAALAALLTDLATSDTERERLAAAGIERAANFSWNRTARLTAEAYRTMLPA